jgi:type I restriction enzyme S subunit
MLDLSDQLLQLVREVLQEYVPDCEVWAFGSRINGKARSYSDLDLVIVGESALPQRTMNRLTEVFQESALPIRVDVLDWNALSPAFQQVILKQYVVVQRKSGEAGPG